MARERYLVGVDPAELEYHPAPSAPQTPKSRWENFWYHYKWVVIFTAFGVAVLAILLVQTFTRVRPDYRVFLASMGYMPDAAVVALQTELEASGSDVNGDGKVVVQVQSANVSLENGNAGLGTANRQALTAHLAAQDVWIFAFAPEYYDTVIRNLVGDKELFEPLMTDETGAPVTYWDWCGAAFLPQNERMEVPQHIYFMVRRSAETSSDQQKTEQQQALALMKTFVG